MSDNGVLSVVPQIMVLALTLCMIMLSDIDKEIKESIVRCFAIWLKKKKVLSWILFIVLYRVNQGP